MQLKDQVAVVTGASRGIGRAVAVALAQAGADVTVNFYGENREAEGVANEIRGFGRRALVAEADVSDQAAVAAMIVRTEAELGPVSIAVTNAAFSDREPFHQAALAGFERTIDVTMWGAFYVLRECATRMIARGKGGSIVVISSPHAVIPVPNSMAYNMAKAAIDQMARTAAIELVDHRIRVNLVYPGWTDTPGERKFTGEAQLQAAAAKLPWKRLCRPEEIARGVVFLCDPASDYITGTTLTIDGGIMLPWWARETVAG